MTATPVPSLLKTWKDRARNNPRLVSFLDTLHGLLDVTIDHAEGWTSLFVLSILLGLGVSYLVVLSVPVLMTPGQAAGWLAQLTAQNCAAPCNFDQAYGYVSLAILILALTLTYIALIVRYGLKKFILRKTYPDLLDDSARESIERISFELTEIRARMGEG